MSTKSLRDKLEERIRATIEAIEHDRADNVPRVYPLPKTDGLDPAALAGIVAADVQRYADALIPDATIRRNVLLDDEIAAQWPLYVRTDPDKSIDETTNSIMDLGGYEVGVRRVYFLHPKVSMDQAGQLLDRIASTDPLARRIAEILKAGCYVVTYHKRRQEKLEDLVASADDPDAYPDLYPDTRGMPPSLFGLPEDEHELNTVLDAQWEKDKLLFDTDERRAIVPNLLKLWSGHRNLMRRQLEASACFVAECSWWPPAVAVLAYVEAKVLAAYKSVVRLPSDPVTAIIMPRSGAMKNTEPKLYTGQSFPVPDTSFRHWRWRIDPPSGTQCELFIPFEGQDVPAPTDVRAVLTGSRIRTWWATWVLAFERDEPDGFFNWNPRHIILDVLKMPPERFLMKGKCRSDGKPFERPDRKQDRQMAADFLFLESCVLRGVGEGKDSIEVQNGEPLLHRFGEVKRNGRTMRDVDLCAHARLAWLAVKRDFIQLPIKAFELDARYAPLAMGIANVLRRNLLGKRAWLERGALSMPLGQLLEDAGEDLDMLRRRFRRQAWDHGRERLSKVIEPAGFGTLHFGRGDGENVIVTIEPNENLAIVYRTALEARDRRKAFDDEAAIRALADEKRGRGRPRQMPHPKRRGNTS